MCLTELAEAYGVAAGDLRRIGDGVGVWSGALVWRDDPLPWQVLGLSETATGYGARLTSSRKVFLAGRWRRVYITCYSNIGTAWVTVKGQRVIVG